MRGNLASKPACVRDRVDDGHLYVAHIRPAGPGCPRLAPRRSGSFKRGLALCHDVYRTDSAYLAESPWREGTHLLHGEPVLTARRLFGFSSLAGGSLATVAAFMSGQSTFGMYAALVAALIFLLVRACTSPVARTNFTTGSRTGRALLTVSVLLVFAFGFSWTRLLTQCVLATLP